MRTLLSLLFLFLIPFTIGEVYYADITLTILPDGDVEIKGLSNHPLLQEGITSSFTFKKEKYWLLNTSFDGTFSDYVVEIIFPDNARITYLHMPSLISIEEKNSVITTTSAGSNDSLTFVVQYSLHKGDTNSFFPTFFSFLFILFFFITLGALFYFKIPKKFTYERSSYTDRQQLILDLLIKNKGSLHQAEIGRTLKLPKSSLSRNIESLVRKGIITKEDKGITNIIYLNKQFK